MVGMGTVINCAAIVAGGIVGMLFGNFMKTRYQEILMTATALCVLFIGISGTLQEMMTVEGNALSAGGTMMVIASFAIGSLIGEIVNPTIIAGIAPIYGPKYGITSVIAQNNAKINGASRPANVNPILCVIKTKSISGKIGFLNRKAVGA